MAGLEFGGDNVPAELAAMIAAKREAGRRAVAKAAALVERNIKVELSRSSHPPKTSTPSRPGSPPSLVSGHLRRGVRTAGPRPIPRGWEATVGPTAEYARVQEKGATIKAKSGRYLRFVIDGRTILTPRVTLPPRPYVAPGWRASQPGIRAIFGAEWRLS